MRVIVLTVATLSSVLRERNGAIAEASNDEAQLLRSLFDEDTMQEMPCLNPDGTMSVPNEFFGDGDDNLYRGRTLEELRRILGQDWGSAWGDCEPGGSDGNGGDSAGGDGGGGFNFNGSNSGDGDDDDDDNDNDEISSTETPVSNFWGNDNNDSNESNDMDESMQEVPCRMPDGSLSVPQEFLGNSEDDFFGGGDDNFWEGGTDDYYGGRKRILIGMTLPKALRRVLGEDNMWGTAWEDCEPATDSGDGDGGDTAGGDGGGGINENTDIASDEIPPPHPDSHHGNPDKIPIIGFLPESFTNEDERHVVRCKVSVALPKMAEEGETHYRGAKNFEPKVTKVMADVIEFATKFQVFKARGGIVYNHRGHSSSKPPYHVDHPPKINDNGLILIHERVLSNFTRVGETNDAIWWKYNIAFFTIADDYNSVDETLKQTCQGAIMSGMFENLLREKYEKLVGVSLPGEEPLVPDLPPVFSPGPMDEDSKQAWGFSEWMGLGLFSITTVLITILGLTGRYRHKKFEEQENWGVKIGTEKDINELLAYGWKYNGSKVIAFDKSKIIYRDDDSMLIGGALPSSEIRCAPTEVMTTMTGSTPTGLSANISRSGLAREMSTNSLKSKDNSLQSKDLTRDTGSDTSNSEDS